MDKMAERYASGLWTRPSPARKPPARRNHHERDANQAGRQKRYAEGSWASWKAIRPPPRAITTSSARIGIRWPRKTALLRTGLGIAQQDDACRLGRDPCGPDAPASDLSGRGCGPALRRRHHRPPHGIEAGAQANRVRAEAISRVVKNCRRCSPRARWKMLAPCMTVLSMSKNAAAVGSTGVRSAFSTSADAAAASPARAERCCRLRRRGRSDGVTRQA